MAELERDDARELERIRRFLTRPGPRFGLAMVVHADRVLAGQARERLIEELAAQGRRVATMELHYDDGQQDLVAQMVGATREDVDALFVVGLDRLVTNSLGWPRQTPALANLNQSRDKLPKLLDVRVVFWVAKSSYAALADGAADFLQVMLSTIELEATREGADVPPRVEDAPPWLDLADEHERPALEAQLERLGGLYEQAASPRSQADAAASAGDLAVRLGQLDLARTWLERAQASAVEADEPGVAAAAARQQAQISLFVGRLDDARSEAEQALELARAANDARQQALARALLAELVGRGGDFEGAIVTLEHEILPVLERSGERESQAAVLSLIADLLELRGDVDEALRVRRGRLAPLLEVDSGPDSLRRLQQTNVAKIADILLKRGDRDEALRISVDMIPAAERQASALANLANVQKALGDLDAARQIRRAGWVSSPRASNLRSRAQDVARQADELHSLGYIEEALALRREQELPAYERLGDERARISTLGEIAGLLAELGRDVEALTLLSEEMVPAARRLGDARLLADASSRAMDLMLDREPASDDARPPGRSDGEGEELIIRPKPTMPSASSARRVLPWLAVITGVVGVSVGVWLAARPAPETVHACEIVLMEQGDRRRIPLGVGQDHELEGGPIVRCQASAKDLRLVFEPASGAIQVGKKPSASRARSKSLLECANLFMLCDGLYQCHESGAVGCLDCECIEDAT